MSTPEKEPIPAELMDYLRNLISERKRKGHGTSNIISGAKIGYEWAFEHLPSQPSPGLRLDIAAFSKLSAERAETGFKTYRNVPITYWTTALMGEGGELCNMIKKMERVAHGGIDGGSSYTAASLTKADLAEEIGGIFIYLNILSGLLDIDMEDAIIETFNSKSDKYDFPQFYPATPSVQPIEREQKPEWVEATTPPEKEGCYNVVTFENILIVTCYQYGRWEYDMEAGGSDAPDWVVRYRPSTHQPLSAPAPEPQPIADKEVPEEIAAWMEQEVQRQTIDFENWHGVNNTISPAFSIGAKKLAIAMYHKRQEEINDILMIHNSISDSYNELLPESIKTSANLIAARSEISTQAIQIAKLLEDAQAWNRAAKEINKTGTSEIESRQEQIAGLLVSNKEWGEKYAEFSNQLEEARSLIEGFVRIWRAEGNKGGAPKNITSAIKFLSQFQQSPQAEK